MTRCVLALGAILLAVGLAGCEEPLPSVRRQLGPPTVAGVRLRPLTADSKLDDPQNFMLLIRFQLTSIQLPIGAVSNSEELWSYLDEEPVGAQVGVALARNGIRIGLASEQAWPDIAKLLTRLTGKPLARRHLQTPVNAPVPVVLKQGLPAQTIFMFRGDRTLIGNDYPPGDNVLMMTARLNYDDPSSVHLLGAAVVRSTRRRQRYVEGPAGFVRVSERDHYPLEGASFRLRVPAGGFIIVGPGRDVRRPNSPGRRFLIHTHKGLDFETILVIAPKVFAAPLPRRG